MSNISAADVKRLREITGVGMMDCKKALEEAHGDFDTAIEILRKKGQKVAAKRADRDAKEGLVLSRSADGGVLGILVEVNAETDFVSRNEEFGAFASEIADVVLAHRPADMDAMNALVLPSSGRSIEEASTDMTGKIGEKIGVRRFALVEAPEGSQVVSYIHSGSRLGVLVVASGEGAEDVARDVAMQVAAMNPVALSRDDVPQATKEKELEIGRELARNEGKPEQMLDRIAEGKLNRYYKDNVLLEQPFVKDSSLSVEQMLKQKGVKVSRFVRFALGE